MSKKRMSKLEGILLQLTDSLAVMREITMQLVHELSVSSKKQSARKQKKKKSKKDAD